MHCELVTYNTDEGQDGALGVVDFLVKAAVDGKVVLAQEVTPKIIKDLNQRLGDRFQYLYRYRGVGGPEYDPHGHGNLTIVPRNDNIRLLKQQSTRIDDLGKGWYPAVLQVVDLEVDKERIRIANLHGTTIVGCDEKGVGTKEKENGRNAMFDRVQEYLHAVEQLRGQMMVILLGDFNTEIKAPRVVELCQRLSAINLLKDAGIKVTRPRELILAWALRKNWPHIQLQADGAVCWGMNSQKVVARLRDDIEWSDHFPVEVTVN